MSLLESFGALSKTEKSFAESSCKYCVRVVRHNIEGLLVLGSNDLDREKTVLVSSVNTSITGPNKVGAESNHIPELGHGVRALLAERIVGLPSEEFIMEINTTNSTIWCSEKTKNLLFRVSSLLFFSSLK